VAYSQTAGFVRPGSLPAWSVTLIGTRAAVDLAPAEDVPPTMTVYRSPSSAAADAPPPERRQFPSSAVAFDAQAAAFLEAVGSGRPDLCRNGPGDALVDVRLAESIVVAARERRTIALD
jgi:predicted dehydrogenase